MAKLIKDLIGEIEEKGRELGNTYDDFEMLAIAVLDSNWDDFPNGLLQYALEGYLADKAKELGVQL